jgi:hypothetical protein
MSTFHSPSLDQLKRAIEISEHIQQLESELQALLGGHTASAPAPAAVARAGKTSNAGMKIVAPNATGKRFVSPEARAKMAAAQRRRWAKTGSPKAAAPAAKPAAKASGKRTLSPEARERIAAAQRRRWAKHRKG